MDRFAENFGKILRFPAGIEGAEAQAQGAGLQRAGAFVGQRRAVQAGAHRHAPGGKEPGGVLRVQIPDAQRQHPGLACRRPAEAFHRALPGQQTGQMAAQPRLVGGQLPRRAGAKEFQPRAQARDAADVGRARLVALGQLRGHLRQTGLDARAAPEQGLAGLGAQQKTRALGAVEALGDDYKIAFQSCEPSCVEGVWDFVIDYNINQIN